MGYDDLIKKVSRIRNARVDARAAADNKPTRQTRQKKAKPAIDKLLGTMTEEEKAAFIKKLESE